VGFSEKVSIVFPMAAGRQTERFRPFDLVAGEAVIHRATRTFSPFRDRIERIYYVYSAAEEAQFDVAAKIPALVDGFPFSTVILDRETAGPAETAARGIALAGIEGRAIVCDIDHRLDVTPIFDAMDADPAQSGLVPIWPLTGESLKRWSVACVDRDGKVREVAERRLPAGSGDFFAIIGCYAFRDAALMASRCIEDGHSRFSGFLNAEAAHGHPLASVKIETAEFFGDREMIREIEKSARNFSGTIFCDIDGTIFEHEDIPSYASLPKLLPGSREKLARWVSEGYYVVLCTARSDRDEEQLSAALHALGIAFHRLICGLPSGPRVLINDRKPSAMFTTQARSFEIERNQGIHAVELPSARHPTVLKRFEGGSFAETLLLESDGRHFVRKRASKHINLAVGYPRLRAQYRTVERFEQLCPGLVPKPISEEDNSHEYFYDMEYLDGYQQLNHLPAAQIPPALGALFDRFNQFVYSQQNRYPGIGDEWFENHIEQKIYAKMDAMAENERLRPLVLGRGVEIDGVFHPSLESLLSDVMAPETRRFFTPDFLSIVHGDLTFQNIMVSDDGSVKAIDMESSGMLDAAELDLGKILQSVLSQYDDWHLAGVPLTSTTPTGSVQLEFRTQAPDPALLRSIQDRWADLLKCSRDLVDLKGNFYLALHLVRMVPFRLKESEDQALYALATALQRMKRSIDTASGL